MMVQTVTLSFPFMLPEVKNIPRLLGTTKLYFLSPSFFVLLPFFKCRNRDKGNKDRLVGRWYDIRMLDNQDLEYVIGRNFVS